jgi:hypothetical protein
VQMYATTPTGGPATSTIYVTIFGSIMGEVDELIRYLHGLGAGNQIFDTFVKSWQPQDFFAGPAALTFFTSSTLNGHPVSMAGDEVAAVGGCLNGVLPASLPYYWGSCTVRVYWTGLHGQAPGAVTIALKIAFEALQEGHALGADSFDGLVEVDPLVPVTSGALDYCDFVVAQADADMILPGEAFRLLVERDCVDEGDTYTGIAQIIGVAMWINK